MTKKTVQINSMAVMVSLLTLLYGCEQNHSVQRYGTDMDNLFILSSAKSRSISPENFTGEKGKGGMATLKEGSAPLAAPELGQRCKVTPYVRSQSGDI